MDARMRKLALVCVLAACGGRAPAPATPPAPAFDPAPWIEDLAALEREMAAGYANLEWSAKRGLDLGRLHRETTEAIQRAVDAGEARAALDRLVDAFADPHLKLVDPDTAAAADPKPAPAAGTPAAEACKAL